MKVLKALLFTSLLTPLTTLSSPAPKGEDLLEHLEAFYQDNAETLTTHLTVSYYMGVVNGLTFYDGPDICSPIGATNSQLMLVVKKHLDDNPQKLHQTTEELIIEALSKAFPCPTEDE